jgi:hypothetical protein
LWATADDALVANISKAAPSAPARGKWIVVGQVTAATIAPIRAGQHACDGVPPDLQESFAIGPRSGVAPLMPATGRHFIRLWHRPRRCWRSPLLATMERWLDGSRIFALALELRGFFADKIDRVTWLGTLSGTAMAPLRTNPGWRTFRLWRVYHATRTRPADSRSFAAAGVSRRQRAGSSSSPSPRGAMRADTMLSRVASPHGQPPVGQPGRPRPRARWRAAARAGRCLESRTGRQAGHAAYGIRRRALARQGLAGGARSAHAPQAAGVPL